MFVARLKAGERGAGMIEVEDLLAALVLEDQGMSGGMFSAILGPRDGGVLVNKAPSHLPFFSPEIAARLLARIEDIMPQSDPVGLTDEMPVSAALENLLDTANKIHDQLQRSQIEPLLLLAAFTAQPPEESNKLLSECGITQESVFAKLRETSDN